MVYEVVLTVESVDEILTVQTKTTAQYFPMVIFIFLHKVVLMFESGDTILNCDHSNEFKATEQFFPVVLFIRCFFPQLKRPSRVARVQNAPSKSNFMHAFRRASMRLQDKKYKNLNYNLKKK